jgi:group I intron endonuclease
VYIGSSINIGNRLVDHIVTNKTHLQSALNSYGLKNFTFCVVEFCDLEVLLQLEQHYLDILFSLPAKLRYNFARFAEAPFKGFTHTPESKAQMSDSQQLVDRSGDNNPMYGRTGALNPMYGRTHTPETRAQMSDSHTGKTHSGLGGNTSQDE